MKTIHSSLVAVLFLFVGFSAHGAEILVAAGEFNLQPAINAASDGDTLVLEDGAHYILGLTINKSLDFKAQTNASPILSAVNNTASARLITIGNASSEVDVTFTGLQIGAMDVRTLSGAEDVELVFVECALTGYPWDIRDNSTDKNFQTVALIGNELLLPHFPVIAENILLLGNKITYSSSTSTSYIQLNARDTAHFVGNEVIDTWTSRPRLLQINSGQNFVVANRFSSDNSGNIQNQQYWMVLVSGTNTRALFKNNLFDITLPDSFQPVPTDPLDTTQVNSVTAFYIDGQPLHRGIVIENNTIDYGMDADDINFTTDSPVVNAGVGVVLRNNIVVNSSRDLIGYGSADAEDLSVVEFNLCDNGAAGGACAGMDIVAGSANLVDDVDYMLDAGSDAIDAGKPVGLFNDVDGSTNDLGVYGGAFPLDQYDVQLEDGRTAPYLYPLFEPNKNVTGDGKLNVRVVGVARSK